MRSGSGPGADYLYRLGPSPRPKQKHPAHARPGSRPRSLRPANTKRTFARPRRPRPWLTRNLVPSHFVPSTASEQPTIVLRRGSGLASAHPGLPPSTWARITPEELAGELENGQNDMPVSCAGFHLRGEGKAISEGAIGGYDTKSATCRTLEVICLGFREGQMSHFWGRNGTVPVQGGHRVVARFRPEPLPFGIRPEHCNDG